MSTMYPITFRWSGEVMEPLNPKQADRQYYVGQTYRLVPFEERSPASHSHYFAAIHEAWVNLPEDATARFPTAEHLRKWALIRAGYRDERSIVCASKAEALRFTKFIKPLDDYAVVLCQDAVVKVLTAKSQSTAAMGKKDFQASKDAVLMIVAELIGVPPGDLAKNASAAA